MVLRRATPPYRDSFGRARSAGVTELTRVPIGGLAQWVLVRGVDRTNPVLLYLHDGPGLAHIPFARSTQRELERAFLVVNWDQRGSGLSYSGGLPAASMTLEALVADTVELARALGERFHRGRIVLLGHGWGAALGALAVARAPELFESFVGADPRVDPREAELRLYRWVGEEARQRGTHRAIRDWGRIGAPPYDTPARSALLGHWAGRFGGVRYEATPRGTRLRDVVELREYTLFDLLRWRRGLRFSRATLGAAAASIDLPTRVTRLEVPTYFVCGRYDRVCDPELAREYLRVLDAPRKGWAWIEEAAHEMPFEQPDALAAAVAHFAAEARGPPIPNWAVAA